MLSLSPDGHYWWLHQWFVKIVNVGACYVLLNVVDTVIVQHKVVFILILITCSGFSSHSCWHLYDGSYLDVICTLLSSIHVCIWKVLFKRRLQAKSDDLHWCCGPGNIVGLSGKVWVSEVWTSSLLSLVNHLYMCLKSCWSFH